MVDATPKRNARARVTSLIQPEVSYDNTETRVTKQLDLSVAVEECIKQVNVSKSKYFTNHEDKLLYAPYLIIKEVC